MNGIDISDITIPPAPKEPTPGKGVYSFIYRGCLLPRGGTCLKVFRHPVDDPANFLWGMKSERGSNIPEATKIQNLYAFAGLAPRVYALLLLANGGNKYYVQVTDDLGTWDIIKDRQSVYDMTDKLKAFAEANDIIYFEDGREKNLLDGKWVDFQGFKFKDTYKDKLRGKVDKICNWHPPSSYQPFPELGLAGRRNNEHRVELMGLDKIDVKDKTVIDLGCSAGWFCNYFDKRGANHVVGIDWFGRADVARELSNYLGFFNIDYYEMDLKTTDYNQIIDKTDEVGFDVVLYLSMSYHIGMPEYLFHLVKNLLVYEGNSRSNDEEFEKKIREKFSKVEKVGETTDLNPRRILWANR